MYKNTNTAVFVPFMLADRYSGVSRTCIIFNINLLNCLGIQVHNLVAKSQWHCNIIFSLLCDIFWVNLSLLYQGKWGINAGFLRYNLIKRLFISLVHNSVKLETYLFSLGKGGVVAWIDITPISEEAKVVGVLFVKVSWLHWWFAFH